MFIFAKHKVHIIIPLFSESIWQFESGHEQLQRHGPRVPHQLCQFDANPADIATAAKFILEQRGSGREHATRGDCEQSKQLAGHVAIGVLHVTF